MTVRRYSSISQETSLVSALNATATTMVVNSAAVLGNITPGTGERFTLVIDPDTALEEIVYATSPSSPSSTTITIIRGVDGTGTEGVSGVAHSAGAKVRHMAIGVDFREANNHIKNETAAHGLTIANVLETTDTDMITTAMLQSNSVTTAKITDANVTTAKIADSNVTTAKIADSAITSAKIADGTIVAGDIADGAITSAKILDGTIATADIANSAVTTAKIADANVTTAKLVDLNVTTGKIADSAITSAKIADGTIVAGDIADGAITSAKILDATIATGDLADGAVTSAKIADGTIVNADINSAAAIDKTKISGTAITTADSGTVTSTMIADGTIVNADVSATAAIAYTKLSLGGTITSADIVDGTIVATDIANGTITAAKMVSDPYARANHTGTQTASTISDFDTQVRASRLDQMAAPTGSVSMNSQKITSLLDPTSAQDASTKAYVDAQVNALVDGAPGTLNTLNEIATAISAGGSFESTVVLKSGSTMTGALTLSGAPTVDLHAATKAYVDTVAGSATAAAASAAAAATTYDEFDDRYLGSKSTPPTLDNDGNALVEGALYWNSVDNAMYAWTGSEWGSISSTAAIFRYRFTAAGGETSESGLDDNGLTLSYIPGKEQVYLNGVLLARTSDYTASNGTSISSLAALTAGDILEIITFTAFDLATAIPNTLFDAKGDILVATSADTPGKLTVGANDSVLMADSSTATGLKYTASTGTGSNVLATSPTFGGIPVINNIAATSGSANGTLYANVTTANVTLGSGITTGAIQAANGTGFNGTVSIASGAGIVNKTVNIGTASTAGTTTVNIGSSAGATNAVTINGTVNVPGDINLSAAGGPGSVIDEFTLILMGAI
jgi:hypothetical protein